jgi:soluble lytic murein transglycosylase-like protein
MIRHEPILAMRQFFSLRFGLILTLLLIGIQLVMIVVRVLSPSAARPEPANLPELSSVFTPEVRHWSPLIYAWAGAYNVDPNLIATLIQIESCGDPQAVSRSGAQGLFQVMPFHFKAGEDMLEVLTNGQRGMEYLASGLQIAAGDPGLALAGYNGGHSLINRGWAAWPAETRRYYEWGTTIYKDALNGLTQSPSLDKWLKAGGSSLCRRASQHQTVAMN